MLPLMRDVHAVMMIICVWLMVNGGVLIYV